jgi:hypothetical protein
MNYIAKVETRIAGIPCIIAVTEFDDNDIDYVVCDRNGRPAPWLARKLTKTTTACLVQDIVEYFN